MLAVLFVVVVLGACQDRHAERTEGSASTPGAPEPSAPPSAAPRRPALNELGRVDVEGFVFGLAIDELGNVLATTRRGRQAAYLITPGMELGQAPGALLLAQYATAPFAVARGVFAVDQGSDVVTLRVGEEGGQPTLVEGRRTRTEGLSSAFARADQRLWVAVRQPTDGYGLLGIDPASGDIVRRLATGPLPVDLRAGPDDHSLVLTLLGANGSSGEVLTVDVGVTPPTPATVPVPGAPTRVEFLDSAEHGGRLLVLRHGQRELLPLVEQGLVPEAPVALGFVPGNVAVERGVAWVVGPEGRLARIAWTDGGLTVTHTRDIAPRSTELVAWPDTGFVALLDAGANAVRLYRKDDLEELAALPTGGTVARMVADGVRSRLYITLPELEQVMVVSVDRGSL